MEITKEYLDSVIIDETNKSGEIFTLYVDFDNSDIDVEHVIDSDKITPIEQLKYKEAVEYYFTLISNTSEFFEEIENETNKNVITFNSIKFHFVNDKIEINVETSTEETKEVLRDYFTRYEEEFGYEDYVEIYNINVLQG